MQNQISKIETMAAELETLARNVTSKNIAVSTTKAVIFEKAINTRFRMHLSDPQRINTLPSETPTEVIQQNKPVAKVRESEKTIEHKKPAKTNKVGTSVPRPKRYSWSPFISETTIDSLYRTGRKNDLVEFTLKDSNPEGPIGGLQSGVNNKAKESGRGEGWYTTHQVSERGVVQLVKVV
jgi:hypothetical protein